MWKTKYEVMGVILLLSFLINIFFVTPGSAATLIGPPTPLNPDPQYIVINPDIGVSESFADELIPALGQGTSNRRLAFAILVNTWDSNGTNGISAQLNAAFAKSESLNLPLFIHLDNEWFFDNRPDLWNWFDPSRPGYNPANRDNVEWSDWNTPVQYSWLNWGQPLKFAPRPCFESTQIRNEITAKETFIANKTLAWQTRLQSLNKPELFAGVDPGWETSIESFKDLTWITDPADRVNLGYCALTKRGFSASNPPADIDSELNKAVKDFAEFEAKALVNAGINKDKVFTHIYGAEGLVLPYKQHAPLWTAVNNYSNPGFSLYPSLYNRNQVLNTKGISKWAIVEMPWNEIDLWINEPGLKLVNLYNWNELIKNNSSAINKIKSVLNENPPSPPYSTPSYATPYLTPYSYPTPTPPPPYPYPTPSSGDCFPGHLFSSLTGKPCAIPPFSTLLTQKLYLGKTHAEVKLLQKYLNNHSFIVSNIGFGSPGNETYYFGLKTKAAVVKFQKAHKLTSDGVVGAKTRAVINSDD